MANRANKLRLLPLIIVTAALFGVAYLGREPYKAVATIHELLAENKNLRQAITNLTDEMVHHRIVLGEWWTKNESNAAVP